MTVVLVDEALELEGLQHPDPGSDVRSGLRPEHVGGVGRRVRGRVEVLRGHGRIDRVGAGEVVVEGHHGHAVGRRIAGGRARNRDRRRRERIVVQLHLERRGRQVHQQEEDRVQVGLGIDWLTEEVLGDPTPVERQVRHRLDGHRVEHERAREAVVVRCARDHRPVGAGHARRSGVVSGVALFTAAALTGDYHQRQAGDTNGHERSGSAHQQTSGKRRSQLHSTSLFGSSPTWSVVRRAWRAFP